MESSQLSPEVHYMVPLQASIVLADFSCLTIMMSLLVKVTAYGVPLENAAR
ncbi:hypothetical protein DPMN_087023 [Dreissena polymorpha]|uniref:Uncharacterized protein n=1 Tax=Dreissena polymorpha TaxID=45954 RepID=A0A9D4KRX6_DREPO|nr:hypothetical protein DPMN_087023 [Dreissena polymorpha]